MRRFALALIVSVSVVACGESSPTAPSPAPPSGPQQETYALTGQVSLGVSPVGISAATVTIEDGPNAGKSAVTDGAGRYVISGLASGLMTARAVAAGHLPVSRAITLSPGSAGAVNWPLVPEKAWSRTGSGDMVFQLPGYFTRIRIQAAPRAECERFVVRIAGRTTVDATLGTCATAHARAYDGVHLTEGGGTVEIMGATGIDWMFNEVRDLQ